MTDVKFPTRILGALSSLLLTLPLCAQLLVIDPDAPGISDGDDISSAFAGAGFISRQMYREFVVPYEREVATSIGNQGIPSYVHTCGAIGDRLELLCRAGVSGIECLDPPPLGDVDLHDRHGQADPVSLSGRAAIVGIGAIVVVRRPGPEGTLVEDDSLFIDAAKDHRPQSSVSDREGFIPVPGRFA